MVLAASFIKRKDRKCSMDFIHVRGIDHYTIHGRWREIGLGETRDVSLKKRVNMRLKAYRTDWLRNS